MSTEKPEPDAGSSEGKMRKEQEKKVDGRCIIFYTFEDEEEDED